MNPLTRALLRRLSFDRRWAWSLCALACTAAWSQERTAPAGPGPQAGPAATVRAGERAVLGLFELYRQALPNEARLKAAEAAYRAGQEQLPLARAQLHPNLSLGVSRFTNRLDNTGPNLVGQITTVHEQYISYNQTLSLRQPVYRPAQMAAVRAAAETVKAAEAQRDQEFPSFASRVGTAYFEALLADGQAQFAAEQVQSIRLQLAAAQKAYAAGSGIRTDVDEVQAQLDLALADQIDAAQFQAYAAQQLAALLAGAPARPRRVRLATLDPIVGAGVADGDTWQQRARNASAELRALRAQAAAAEEDIARARDGHKPTLDVLLQRTRSGNENENRPGSSYNNTSLGLQLNVPLYSGGYVSAQTRQAVAELERAKYQLAAAETELDTRVRKEYRSVVEGVARHRALLQALASARSALRSVERSFEAGVRTRVDIARASQKVATQQRDLLNIAYSTLMSRLRLELLASGNEAEVNEAVQWMDRLIE